jgi:hypothetical protein
MRKSLARPVGRLVFDEGEASAGTRSAAAALSRSLKGSTGAAFSMASISGLACGAKSNSGHANFHGATLVSDVCGAADRLPSGLSVAAVDQW